MPLNPSGLQSSLQSLAASPGADIAACAKAWADAMKSYAAGIIPASTTVTAAATTLQSALASAFAQPSAASAMETAFAAFATTVGGGMAPAFTATPPTGPVGFATQFAQPFPATHAAAASAMSSLIDTWMKKGKGTPPVGTPVNWT